MSFLPQIYKAEYDAAKNDNEQLYELLVTPLHEELYKQGSFDFMEGLTDGQQLLLAFDYIRGQVGQGGFIQLLHNGYVGLLPELPKKLIMIGDSDMAKIIDDVLVLFVQNHEALLAEISPQEFAKLYLSLPAFAPLDKAYENRRAITEGLLMDYARKNIHNFATIVE